MDKVFIGKGLIYSQMKTSKVPNIVFMVLGSICLVCFLISYAFFSITPFSGVDSIVYTSLAVTLFFGFGVAFFFSKTGKK